jgi:hypothetical protein
LQHGAGDWESRECERLLGIRAPGGKFESRDSLWFAAIDAEKKQILAAAAAARQAQRLAWQAELLVGGVLCLLVGIAVGLALNLSLAPPATTTAQR